MKEKLRILMQNEKLTASRLADILEIKPAGVSHILSGRNNPSFELICKIVNRFPQINPYWLLGDSEQIYNSSATESTQADVQNGASVGGAVAGDLFNMAESSTPLNSTRSDEGAAKPMAEISRIVGSSTDIEKIVVFYADKSFESFTPRK